MASAKRVRLCQLPKISAIRGRSSSITSAFFNSIIPVIEPEENEVLEALSILEIDKNVIRCAYCGDKSSEWDHPTSVIEGQRPTGFITEMANLVAACGKCNQPKGKQNWMTWMLSSARLSPTSGGIPDLA
jgi:5-methylcytosine-specific restriction endonuclease McrA